MSNVVLITIDSLRSDHVGCYGYERDTTPNIDSVASTGAVFENAFAHACSTRPSFPSIITSSYPMMYGGYEQLSERRTLVSEVFSNEGYGTAGFHSNAYLNPEFGYGRGWDTFYDSRADPSTIAELRQWVKSSLDKDGIIYKALASAFDTAERHAGANIGSAYVDADEITDRAIKWDKKGSEQKNFLWVHYMDVHHPYVPPEEHQLAFREDPINERRAIQLRRKFIESPESVTNEELADIIDLYDAEIRFTDAEIGRLLSTLDKLWDERTTLITADHGEEFREHGQFSHYATFYDEVLHVPMILDGDHQEGRYDELVGLLDVAPTLLEMSGLDVPEKYYGYSLQSLIGDGEWPRNQILGDWASDPDGPRRFVYRDQEWKYIQCPDHEELYALQPDPKEKENLIGSENEPEIVENIRQVIETHKETIESTDVNVEQVEMDEEVKEQLRDLGYKE